MKNGAYTTHLQLLDINLRFYSEKREFVEFINDFTGLSSNNTSSASPHIIVRLNPPNFLAQPKDCNKISRNIWIGESQILITEIERFPGLKLRITLESHILMVDAFLEDTNPNSMRKLLKSWLVKNRYNHLKYIGLVYYLIYLPFLYYMERFRNLFLIHAGAVEFQGQGIILAGLGGVGKSTFSLGSMNVASCKFLSDNIIFHNETTIYPLPEPIALDSSSKEFIGNAEKHLQPINIPSSHNRMYYHVRPDYCCSAAIPKSIFWLQWGEANEIKPLAKDDCIKGILKINLLAKELREYYILAAAIDLAFPQPLSSAAYIESLSSLISTLNCYTLQIKPGDAIQSVFNATIGDIIP